MIGQNCYQYRYTAATNTHLNNSSPKPFSRAELAGTTSPKTVKKVEFDRDETGKAGKSGEKRSQQSCGGPEKEDKRKDEAAETGKIVEVELCVEMEPGTSDL